MPKARKKSQTKKIGNAQGRSRTFEAKETTEQVGAAAPDVASVVQVGQRRRRMAATRGSTPTNLAFSGMVALGCWGMAFSFAFFYSDPNHYLFAGMACMMGLLWSYSTMVRLHTYTKTRQQGLSQR